MRLGQSTGNMDLYLQGQRAVDALDMQSGASNVYQAVLGADQRTLDAFANKFTAHTKIPGNMVVGKDGITRLTFDDGKAITMDRGQLAQYVTALYRMDKGDATAIKDIGAINTELASRASDAFKNMHTVATTNNQATGIARQMQHYGTLEARAGAAAAERKSVMDAAKPYLDKYEQLSDADKNGPAGVSLLRQAQVAAARKSGDLNQVVQGLLPKGKGALSPEQDKNYRAALMELGPRPAPTTGFFGGLDDSAGKTWDTRNNWIRSVYGVSDPSAAGGDQTDEILARVKAKLEGGDTTAKPPTPRAAPVPVAQNPAAPTMSPQEQRAARIAEIRQALAVDDDIKSSWTGMGLRAVSNRAFPMGMGTRFEMERELARLTGG